MIVAWRETTFKTGNGARRERAKTKKKYKYRYTNGLREVNDETWRG